MLRGGSEQSGIEGPCIQEEEKGASISGGGFPSVHTVHVGQECWWDWRAWYGLVLGGSMSGGRAAA